MPDPIIDDPNTVVDGNWYDTMAGEDAGKIDILSKFDSADAFYDNHQELTNANWRTPFVAEGEDGKYMERFDSPAAFGKAFNEAQHTIRSGQLKSELPEGATDEDVAAFRKDNGIPAEAAGYMEGLPDGLVIGDDDKPIAEFFMNRLHSVNADPKVAHALLTGYSEFAEAEQDAQAQIDTADSKEATDALRNEWKADYRTNINAVETFLLNTFGKEVKEQFMNGRFGDGKAFMNDPRVLQAIAAVQRKIDPLVPLLHTGDGDPAESLNDEITKIELFMKEHRTKYNKDEPMQARLRELYDMRTKHQAA